MESLERYRGNPWWHWALAAAIVVTCLAALVVLARAM